MIKKDSIGQVGQAFHGVNISLGISGTSINF